MSIIIAEVSIVPLGAKTPSLSHFVAEVEKTLADFKNIKTLLTPMGTVLEGEIDDVLAAIRKMHETPFLQGAQRVSTRISIDDRRDKTLSMIGKIEAVKSKLNNQ